MELRSPAFEHGGRIPSQYACDGADVSPALEITGVPAGAASLALVMDDPDAPMGTFDHWLVWNIPAETRRVEEGVEPEGVQGRTGFGGFGHGGPCPRSGTHRYRFTVCAPDTELGLVAGSRKPKLQEEMEGHVLAQATLEGTYSRGR